MVSTAFSSYKVEDRTYISIVKREIHKKIIEAGFSPLKAGQIDIIVSELASNLIKHTDNGGELIFRFNADEKDNKFFELFCIDQGGGTDDIQKMMRDGISSTNTLGQGLGALNRLSDFFQIYSMRGWGTVAYSKKALVDTPNYTETKTPIQTKVIQECIPGEKVCGDGYYVKVTQYETQIFLGDGLGHGPHAHDAVNAAISAFKECSDSSPVGILRYIHERVKKTRGLVATIAVLDHRARTWKITGVGNISTRLQQGLEFKNYMPYNGIIGLNIPNTISDNEIKAEKFQTIIMASDGIRTKWDLARYASILKYDSAIIAASLFKDHARKNDDMTVLVGKLVF